MTRARDVANIDGILTTKGDIYAATAASTPARLGVGSNGETLVADSSTSTGLRWQGSQAAGRNLIINGDFSVWQRGTTFTSPSFADYTADRFRNINYDVAPTTYSITRQSFAAADAPANLPESGYFFRSSLTTIGSTTQYDTCSQRVEGVMNSGATMTFSFYAKSDSSRTQQVIGVQNYGVGGGTENTSLTAQSFTTTTSWQRFSFTFTINSTAAKTIGTSPYFYTFFRQACASGSVLDITGVQLEYSSVATPFQTATGTIQGELAACQRYYLRETFADGKRICVIQAYAATGASGKMFDFPVIMRTTPTASASATTHFKALNATAGAFLTSSAISLTANPSSVATFALTVATGLVAGNATEILSNSNDCFIDLSAEL
jgi:hypothetical protein